MKSNAHREQLHQLPAKILLGFRFRIRPAVQPDEHRRILGDVDQQIPEVAERMVTQQFDLTAELSRIVRRLGRHQPGAFLGAKRARNLTEGSGKVVMPEERHLFLEWTRRMHHSEQPALAGIRDHRVRPERTLARRQQIARLPDEVIHIVRKVVVVDEVVDDGKEAQGTECGHLGGTCAKAGTPQQVLMLVVRCHSSLLLEPDPVTFLKSGGAVLSSGSCFLDHERSPSVSTKGRC